MIRIQIQNHNIAIAGSTKQIDSILIRLHLDFEFLAERRAEKRVERSVFRKKPDLDHCWTRSLTVLRPRRLLK
jgi:hypothetical protein